MRKYDVIVLGLGAMGSATVYQLAKRRVNVLGIDQFAPPHSFGSSHGESRITRKAIREGEEYTQLVFRSYEILDELEKQTGESLLVINRGLLIADQNSSLLSSTIAIAEKYNIPYETLTANEMRKRYPQFHIKDNEKACLEETAGFIRPERCLEAQLTLAKKLGAELHIDEKVTKFLPQKDNTVIIQTSEGEYHAKKLVITAGAWVTKYLPEQYKKFFTIYRQVLCWFAPKASVIPYFPENLPVYMWPFGGEHDDFLYGFPIIDKTTNGVKLSLSQYSVTTTADTLERNVTEEEIQKMYEKGVAHYLPGLSNTCVKAAACAYTMTPDGNFVIDTHPEYRQVIIASPCSGHGFKHSPAIGEVLAELAIRGESTIDISKFSLKRFGN